MKKNNKKGFTLVELVIVVAVMAILVAIAIPTVQSITGKATSAVNETNAQTIESMLKLEMADTNATTLSADSVGTAVADAKLGITKGEFSYKVKTGAVAPFATGDVASADLYIISFDDKAGYVTVLSNGTTVEKALEITPPATTVSGN